MPNLAKIEKERLMISELVSGSIPNRSRLVYLGHAFQTQGTDREDHVRLGTIVART
jgi:hypothetical protein